MKEFGPYLPLKNIILFTNTLSPLSGVYAYIGAGPSTSERRRGANI